jgi:hypothetical protein
MTKLPNVNYPILLPQLKLRLIQKKVRHKDKQGFKMLSFGSIRWKGIPYLRKRNDKGKEILAIKEETIQ